MKTTSAAKIAAEFADYLDASQHQPVLITRDGKPVALLVAVRDKAEAEQVVSRKRRSLRSVLEEGHDQLEKGKGIPAEEFWRQVEQRRAKRTRTGPGKPRSTKSK